jgi:hypothetical protein
MYKTKTMVVRGTTGPVWNAIMELTRAWALPEALPESLMVHVHQNDVTVIGPWKLIEYLVEQLPKHVDEARLMKIDRQ